jgi:hypothetical protein
MGITAFVLGIGLGANDKKTPKTPGHVQSEKALEVHIPAIHDVEGAGLRQQDVEDIDVVQFAVGDVDKCRDIAAKIQQGMELDGGFGGAEQSPGKDRQAQVDGRGIEGINRIVQIEPQVLIDVQWTGDANQCLG